MRGLWLSDEHTGQKEDNCWKEVRLPALKAFGQLAVDEGCSFVYNNGDGIDDRPWLDVERRSKLMRQIGGFRAVLDNVRRQALEVVWQRGNHDTEDVYPNAFIEEHLGPMTFPDGLVHRFPTDDVVSTHGHILPCNGLSSILPLRGDANVPELLEDRRLRALPSDADVSRPVTMLETGMPHDVARTLDRNLKAMRAHFKKTFGGERVKAAIASFEAARFALSVGAKVILNGHTHVPKVETVVVPHPVTGEEGEILVANSGSFQKGNPTALLVDTDEESVTLYEHDRYRGPVPVQTVRFPGATPTVYVHRDVLPMLKVVG